MRDKLLQTLRAIPWAAVIAWLAFIAGAGLTVGAVYLLCGAGWALLSGAALSFLVSVVIFRGL